MFVFESDVPSEAFFATLDMFANLIDFEPECLDLLHLNQYIPQIEIIPLSQMGYTHILPLIALLLLTTHSLPNPVYTIHYVRSYRNDLIQKNFGCGHSIVYGVYLYPMGPVDALYALMNSHVYGFSSNCQRPATYIKLFGDAQDYEKLLDLSQNVVNKIIKDIERASPKNAIINWKYLPEDGTQRQKGRKALQDITNGLKQRGFNVIIKAPASYFCLNVGGKKYILDQPANEFIMELYGEEPGQYTTYQSVFGEKTEQGGDGYSSDCSKYPTRPMLSVVASDKKVYFEKTMDPSQPGFIGPKWEEFLTKIGSSQANTPYFYDGFPEQTVSF